MYREQNTPKREVLGRYVILRAFKNRRLERHAESDNRKYAELCARALIACSKANHVEHVQLIDIAQGNTLLYEGRA